MRLDQVGCGWRVPAALLFVLSALPAAAQDAPEVWITIGGRDVAQVKGTAVIGDTIVTKTLDMLGIDTRGLDDMDRTILKTIIDKFEGGPVGLSTLGASIGEETETLEEVYEPYLIQLGFLKRTPRGRQATANAYRHLGLIPPAVQPAQEELL